MKVRLKVDFDTLNLHRKIGTKVFLAQQGFLKKNFGAIN